MSIHEKNLTIEKNCNIAFINKENRNKRILARKFVIVNKNKNRDYDYNRFEKKRLLSKKR